MNIVNQLAQAIPSQFRTLAKRFSYFLLGTALTLFYSQIAHAQAAGNTPVRTPYSATTVTAAIIAAVITVFFLRGMYLVLTYASETYGLEDEDDRVNTEKENNALLFGAASWVFGSAIIIASYGWGWQFLFLGPIICLLGPIVPIIAMNLDIKKYQKILANRTLRRSIGAQENEFIRKP